MTEYIKKSLDFFVNNREHKQVRKEIPIDLTDIVERNDLSDEQKALQAHKRVLENEEIVVFPFERIAGTRVMLKLPPFKHAPANHLGKRISHMLNETTIGGISNNIAEYGHVIQVGLSGVRKEIEQQLALKADDVQAVSFLQNQMELTQVLQDFADRMRDAAKKAGNTVVYETFCNIPENGAKSFHEALQFLRFLNFVLRYENPTHSPFGRFDQYMYPYFKADRETGLSYEDALEMVEDFFLTTNRDSDIYFGIQQGDNGQAMVLGGCDADGNVAYNELSEISLKASLELGVIDPKINLRVDSRTPFEVYQLGSKLTKRGLGFPQYENDDIVIPALVSWGYELKDARDYGVAGCWEIIMSGYGAEGINYEAMPFVELVNDVIRDDLSGCKTFEDIWPCLNKRMEAKMKEIDEAFHNTTVRPSPMHSLLSKEAIQKGKDISVCGKYNNFGLHGPGIATAVDSLEVIKKYIFEEKSMQPEELCKMVEENFQNNNECWHMLRYDAPKYGNDIDEVDSIAVRLIDMYAEVLSHYHNAFGGIYRPGTGSAMYYQWMAEDLGASADGRLKGEPLPANYSPSLNVKLNGPVSMFKSLTKPDLKKVCNGGPVTLELHDSVFRNDEAIDKVALLVKTFMELGGHQLQLNAVNSEVLLAAQKDPDKYRNLVVRVWGWSGYFVELSKEYQDHIIKRAALTV